MRKRSACGSSTLWPSIDMTTSPTRTPPRAAGPFGVGQTVTSGIVSALARTEVGRNESQVFIQTDAAINPGNSGGALIDASGSVVGINSALLSVPSGPDGQSGEGSIGLGFAIPINDARTVAEQLIHTGKAVHATIGLAARSVTDGTRDGAYVLQVVPEGPAAQAGLKAGDVITVVDGRLIDSADELTVTVQMHQPGDTVKVRYYRGSKQNDVTVTLAAD